MVSFKNTVFTRAGGTTPPAFQPLDVDGVIFLADMIDPQNRNTAFANRRDLEKTTHETRDEVMAGLRGAGYAAVHLEHPSDLTQDLAWARRHVVLSTYGGEVHRSRTTWAPAICEAHDIPYVGLDAYGQGICHSKMAAKRLAREAGLKTPRAREYHAVRDLRHLSDWAFPVIVKPSSEGSSIGISQDSIAHTEDELEAIAAGLFAELDTAVMVEEFVAGREVSFAAIQTHDGAFTSFNEVVVAGAPEYFATRVWDAAEKFRHDLPRRVNSIDAELREEDCLAISRFLTALGDYGYIRLDGRLSGGRLHFLEATPDAWLGVGGQLCQGFENDGWTYAQVIAAIIETARARLPSPAATG
ncbi:MAG: D-alanine--D-alanine ligase [Pseudomonadota bacterium]